MKITSELFLLLLYLFVLATAVRYGIKQHDYVALAWSVSQTLTVVYYALLVFHWPGFATDIPLRQAIIRPAQVFSVVILTFHFGNGAINRIITRVLKTVWTPRKLKP